MDCVYEILQRIAQATGKQKQAIISEHIDDELFFSVVSLALNAQITFGIGKKTIQKIEAKDRNHIGQEGVFDDGVFLTLEQLSKRELTGGNAVSVLTNLYHSMKAEHWSVLKRILLKDLRCGFSVNTVNTVKAGAIPVFAVMLAEKYDANRIESFPVNVEIKHDGVRVTTTVDMHTGEVKTLSRSGNEFKTFNAVKDELLNACSVVFAKAHKLVFDGEIKSGKFNKTVGDVHKKDFQAEDAQYHIFDILTYDEFYKECKTAQKQRRKRLESFFTKLEQQVKLKRLKLMHSVQAHSDEEVQQLFEQFFNEGHEGAIVKLPDAVYVNKRGYSFMKLKNEESEDLTIIALAEGELGKKYQDQLGALVVNYKGVQVNVSSGLSDSDRIKIWKNKAAYIGRIVEVEYHEVTEDGSLRHPRFKRFRDILKKGQKD